MSDVRVSWSGGNGAKLTMRQMRSLHHYARSGRQPIKVRSLEESCAFYQRVLERQSTIPAGARPRGERGPAPDRAALRQLGTSRESRRMAGETSREVERRPRRVRRRPPCRMPTPVALAVCRLGSHSRQDMQRRAAPTLAHPIGNPRRCRSDAACSKPIRTARKHSKITGMRRGATPMNRRLGFLLILISAQAFARRELCPGFLPPERSA
jgi:hypothetical protein